MKTSSRALPASPNSRGTRSNPPARRNPLARQAAVNPASPRGGRRLAARGPKGPRACQTKARAGAFGPRPWLSKKWLAPLIRGFHSSLAPTARPGSYAGRPLLRKAFCGFAVHAAKSDYSLRGLRPPNPQGFFDRLGRGPLAPALALCALGAPAAPRLRPWETPGQRQQRQPRRRAKAG